MRPDDVKAALDALASEVPAPAVDAGTVRARGRQRRTHRRIVFVGVAAALIAAIAIVGGIARLHHSPSVVSTGPAPIPAGGGPPNASSQFPSALEGWKCGNPLQYTDDGGQSWRNVKLPAAVPRGGGQCTAIPGGNVWLEWFNRQGVGHILRIRHLTDTQVFSLPPIVKDREPFLPTFIDADHGWFRGGSAMTLYRTIDGGATWTVASPKQPLGPFAFVNAELGWSVDGRKLLATTNGGMSWHNVLLPAPPIPRGSSLTYFEVAARGRAIVVWGGTSITISRYRTFFDASTDDGKTWAERGPAGFEMPGAGNNFFSATDGSHWQLSSGAEFRITEDGGQAWQARPDLPIKNSQVIYPMVFPTANVGWIMTDGGKTWRTTDSGRSWTNVTNGVGPTSVTTPPRSAEPPQPVPIPLAVASSREAWLCSDPAQYTDDGGARFENAGLPSPAPAPAPARSQSPSCTAIPGGDAWMLTATSNGHSQIIQFTQGGRDEGTLPVPDDGPNSTVTDLTFANTEIGWALTETSGTTSGRDLYATGDGGKFWDLVDPGTPVTGEMTFSDPANGWAFGPGATLEHTTDGGRTWQPVLLPVPRAVQTLGVTGASQAIHLVVTHDAVIAVSAVPTENLAGLFFDVSTDGGRSWIGRIGPADAPFGTSEANAFSATDADHWQFSAQNALWTTTDGGRTWKQVAEFSGASYLTSVAFLTPRVGFVSGVGAPPDRAATVVLQTNDGGQTWTNVDEMTPAISTGNVVNFPGGLVGCPTRPLAPVPPGNPPAGLVDAARNYLHVAGGSTAATVAHVYPVGADPAGSFGTLFRYQVGSCGADAVADSWVVELVGPPAAPALGDSQWQLALAHYADGWHVFGRYH